MRVLLFHPWGRFDGAFCGAGHAACAHLEYFRHRGWEVIVPSIDFGSGRPFLIMGKELGG